MKVILLVFSCVFALFLMFAVTPAQADTLHSRIYSNSHTVQDGHKDNLIARCRDCIECGKDVEQMGDRSYRAGDYESAIAYYKDALSIYKTSLSSDPSNRCVRNGFMRTQSKLKQLLNK